MNQCLREDCLVTRHERDKYKEAAHKMESDRNIVVPTIEQALQRQIIFLRAENEKLVEEVNRLREAETLYESNSQAQLFRMNPSALGEARYVTRMR